MKTGAQLAQEAEQHEWHSRFPARQSYRDRRRGRPGTRAAPPGPAPRPVTTPLPCRGPLLEGVQKGSYMRGRTRARAPAHEARVFVIRIRPAYRQDKAGPAKGTEPPRPGPDPSPTAIGAEAMPNATVSPASATSDATPETPFTPPDWAAESYAQVARDHPECLPGLQAQITEILEAKAVMAALEETPAAKAAVAYRRKVREAVTTVEHLSEDDAGELLGHVWGNVAYSPWAMLLTLDPDELLWLLEYYPPGSRHLTRDERFAGAQV